jgi:hypothetical protein
MPYQPTIGGYNWRQECARGRHLLRQQRELIEMIVEGGLSQAQLFQTLTAIALTNSRVDDVIADLAQFKEEK